MSLLLHVSDPHFGTERPEVVEALVRFAQVQRPDLLVLSGDITQRARPAQFRAARAFVDRLAVPRRVVIPGNHDIPLLQLGARLCAPYGRFRRVFGEALEGELDLPDLRLIALNTTRWYRHVDGEVSPAQIERVARGLASANPGQVRVVVTHQPVAVSRPGDEHDRVHGHAQAIARWAEAGADLVLGGHIHLPSVNALHERGAGLARPLWGVQAGTATSSRTRHEAGNSVNLIRVEGPGDGTAATRRSEVMRWDFQASAGEFACVDRQVLHHADKAAADERGSG